MSLFLKTILIACFCLSSLCAMPQRGPFDPIEDTSASGEEGLRQTFAPPAAQAAPLPFVRPPAFTAYHPPIPSFGFQAPFRTFSGQIALNNFALSRLCTHRLSFALQALAFLIRQHSQYPQHRISNVDMHTFARHVQELHPFWGSHQLLFSVVVTGIQNQGFSEYHPATAAALHVMSQVFTFLSNDVSHFVISPSHIPFFEGVTHQLTAHAHTLSALPNYTQPMRPMLTFQPINPQPFAFPVAPLFTQVFPQVALQQALNDEQPMPPLLALPHVTPLPLESPLPAPSMQVGFQESLQQVRASSPPTPQISPERPLRFTVSTRNIAATPKTPPQEKRQAQSPPPHRAKKSACACSAHAHCLKCSREDVRD